VAERAWRRGPFASVEDLHAAMMRVVGEASRAEQLALLRAHPELAGREAGEGTLTPDSSNEQGRLGFTGLSRDGVPEDAGSEPALRERLGSRVSSRCPATTRARA